VAAQKWVIALGIVVVAFLGITLVDKQREQDCRDASIVSVLKEEPTASEVTITNVAGDGDYCQGFLPW
jgi:hypothetical protein